MSQVESMSLSLKSKERYFNDIVNERKANRTARAKQVDYIADKLVEKFHAPQSRPFFCKCAWRLSESTIWSIAGCAEKPNVKCPVKYFVASCKSKF